MRAVDPTPTLIPRDFAERAGNNFDAIRLLMALAVVWSHSFNLTFGDEELEPVNRLLNGVTTAGGLGVMTFFTISGFLITLSFDRSRTLTRFLWRRICRIHPAYLASILVCGMILTPIFSSRHFLQISAREAWGLLSDVALRNYLLPSDAFGKGIGNGPLWSIPLEFACYLLVLGCGALRLLRFRLLFPVAAAAIILIKFWPDAHSHDVFGGGIYACFLLGMAVYLYRDLVPRSRIIVAVIVVLLGVACALPLLPSRLMLFLILPPSLAYLTFYAAYSYTIRWHGAANWGDFSYGVYLYGWPVQLILRHAVLPHVSLLTFAACSMVGALIAGAASWHLVERWFVGGKRGWSLPVLVRSPPWSDLNRIMPSPARP